MASRSNRYSRYDDPYTYDDPYRHEPPNLGQNVGYEYVGTDEPGFHPDSPPPRYEQRRPSPDQRKNRTTSPPRRSRRHAEHSPPRGGRHSSPPRHSRRHSPPRPALNAANLRSLNNNLKHSASEKRSKYQDKYQEWAQGPNVKRAQSYGKKGLQFMGEAAAAYVAAQHGDGGDSRDRSGARGYRDVYDEPPRRRYHRREPSYSPTRSPSPPRRSRHRHAEASGGHSHGRRKSYSPSPPPRNRGYADDRGRRDDRRRGRAVSLSPSPPPRNRGRPRGKSTSGTPSGGGFGKSMLNNMKTKDSANATRWQMAARAALEAGGVTAFRLRKQPGAWAGEKGAKVATAALGAAAIDAFVDKDPRRSRGGGMKGMAENIVGGLIASKLTGVQSNTTRSGKPRYGY